MKIEMHRVPIRELVKQYLDDPATGSVTAYDGNLDVRPAYQREFVYNEKQRVAVIDTVTKDFPLNVLYWADRGDGTYEVMDGQQRTISICQYVTGGFSRSDAAGNALYFHNLAQDEKDQILDYELMVYVCEGTDSEKLDWFRTINIAGEKLTAQELLNAIYHGSWLSDAKKFFSKTSGPAYQLGSDYLNGKPIRQDYLETALGWVAARDQLATVDEYMAAHQHDVNANDITLYYKSVVDWAQTLFPVKRKELRSVDWGDLYRRFHTGAYDGDALEIEVSRLMADEDVTKKAGIYPYLLDDNERRLSIRAFTDRQKREAFERQGGVCPVCSETYLISQMHGDHITPWSAGGRTISDNCQMLCVDCNRRKSNV